MAIVFSGMCILWYNFRYELHVPGFGFVGKQKLVTSRKFEADQGQRIQIAGEFRVPLNGGGRLEGQVDWF
jgi:hypothetical protein